MLSLYEASHVRIPEDGILDEALAFTTTHLKAMVDKMSSPLAEQVAHALYQPLHKGMVRLESKYYISFYQQDASHDKNLLKFAKLDFNLLQSLHQRELRDISGWWKDLYSKVPFVKDRLVEGNFWTLGCFYEPQYSIARRYFIKIFLVVLVFDDTFDAYGNYEILKLLAEAVHRWDYGYIAQLPKYFNTCYQALLETVDEMEKELAIEGRSYAVHYIKEQMKHSSEAWLREAKWCCEKYTPKFDEYLEVAMVSVSHTLGIVAAFLGMQQSATEEGFKWVCQDNAVPKIVETSQFIFRS